MFDFNDNTKNYREIIDRNIKITGADSMYFADFKVKYSADLLKNSPKNKLNILDYGSGDGLTEKFFLKYFPYAQITGLDISENFVKKAKSLNLAGTNFVHFDGKTVPFSDNYFDLVYTACVLHHISEKNHQQTYKDFFRILKKGGHLHIYEHNPLNPFTSYQVSKSELDTGVKLLYSTKLLKNLLSVGFSKVRVMYIMFFPRHSVFKPFHSIEKYLKNIPFGGQYVIEAEK